MIPVIIFGAYALSAVAAQSARSTKALESELILVSRKLFESPGDWSATPPDIGLALEDPSGSIWSFVVDPEKLANLSSLSYEEVKNLLGLEEVDVRISFYRLNATLSDLASGAPASFDADPSLVLGSKITKGLSAAGYVYVYLAGDADLGFTTLQEGFYRVLIEVFWG